MNFFTRLSNGWNISMNSFKVLRENKQLVIFPILSGFSMMLILGSFFTILLAGAGWDVEQIDAPGHTVSIIPIFFYYLVNYFVVVFFNTALVHCTRLYFEGEEVTIEKGLRYAFSRIGAILGWAVFAATVGTILRLLEKNTGWIGRLLLGFIGIIWSVSTFFVVPVIAYENQTPLGAFKRSASLMRNKWGESLGATFSFGLVQFLAILAVGIPLFLIGAVMHIVIGIALALVGILIVMAIISASQMIFVSAVYHNINGDPVKHFNQQTIDQLFQEK